jgi:PhnB protein
MKANPYLFFGGRCAEAVEYYRETLGAEVRALVRFRDMPCGPSDADDRVMHAELDIEGSIIFASDGDGNDVRPSGFAISLQARDDVEAERLFAALSDQGSVGVPLMSTPFASRFGMTTDRYGTPWMVTTPQPAP